jgi:hypothetical protein
MRAALLACLLPVLTAQAVLAAPTERFEISGWDGAAYDDEATHEFSHCTVSASYGPAVLTFALDRNGDFRIEIADSEWALRTSRDYTAQVGIDARKSLQVIAAARSPQRITIDFGDDDQIMGDIQRGAYLRVIADQIGLSFNLVGSSQALARLQACLNLHAKAAPASAR